MTSLPRFTCAVLFAVALLRAGPCSGVEVSAQTSSTRKLVPPKKTASKTTKKKTASVKSRGSSSASAKHGKSTKAAASKAKRHHGPPLTAYRTGHGDSGVGTTKVPAPYTAPAPLPSVATGPAPITPTSLPGRIEFPEHLDHLFARLQDEESGDNQQTVRILQFGDSHTAADMFTGRMRSLFQQRFGNGGAGFTYAGHPFAGYRILGTSRAQSNGWIDEGVHFTKIVNTELGLGGVANTSTRAGDSIGLDAPCALLQVQYLNQPEGGSFQVTEDGRELGHVSTDNPVSAETFETPCTSSSESGLIHHFQVVADSGRPVRLFGTVTERPGTTYESLGLNGAEAALILRWDQPIFTSYLKQRDPALIVLAYGTNEASNHNWTYESYRELLGKVVDMLHATVPDASILLVGPPDRSLRVGRRRSAHWQTFAATVHITDAQRDVCKAHDCAFWDWRARMGGLGSMNRWASEGLAQQDHTHFTSAGYIQLADLFYSDMIGAYEVWKGSHPTPPHTVSSAVRQP
jgi:lysophospholipase L1-like esterase